MSFSSTNSSVCTSRTTVWLYAKNFSSSFAFQLAFVSWTIHTADSSNPRTTKSARALVCAVANERERKKIAVWKLGNFYIMLFKSFQNCHTVAANVVIEKILSSLYNWSWFFFPSSLFVSLKCVYYLEIYFKKYNENVGNAIYSWEISSLGSAWNVANDVSIWWAARLPAETLEREWICQRQNPSSK